MAYQPPSPLEWEIYGSILPLSKGMHDEGMPCFLGPLFIRIWELVIVYAVEAHTLRPTLSPSASLPKPVNTRA